MNDLQTRLQHAMNLRECRAKSLSIEAGLNETAIRDILKGRSKNPRTDTTRKIAKILKIRHEWLVDGFGSMEHEHTPNTGLLSEPNNAPFILSPDSHARKIPLYTLKTTSDDPHFLYRLTSSENIHCPSWLATIEHAFACYCPDNRLAPACYRGDILFIHPNKPVKNHQLAFIETQDDAITIACITYKTTTSIRISYHNNSEATEIDLKQVKHLYSIASVQFV